MDALLEQGNRRVPIEFNSGETVTRDDFKGIDLWRKLVKNDEHPAALVDTGDKTFRRKNVIVYRWSSL